MRDSTDQSPSVLIVSVLASDFKPYRCVCEDLADRLRSDGWNVSAVSKKRQSLARVVDMVTGVWTNATNYQVAYVDVFSGRAFVWAEAVCTSLKLLNKPYVLTLRGGGLPEFASRWPRRTRSVFDGAAEIISPSGYLADQMHAMSPEITVLDNPLNVGDYTYRERDVLEPSLVWLRSFHEIYAPTLAVRVLARLASDYPDARLRMTGPDKGDGSRQAVENAVASLNVSHRVFTQEGIPKARVPNELTRGDIFVNTASVDNTPVSVLEAMASGLCIVSTDVGGIPYMLEHEHDALLVPPDDPDAMAQAIRRLLGDPGLARSLSRNARKKAERHDWSHVLPRWKQILNQAAGRGRVVQTS